MLDSLTKSFGNRCDGGVNAWGFNSPGGSATRLVERTGEPLMIVRWCFHRFWQVLLRLLRIPILRESLRRQDMFDPFIVLPRTSVLTRALLDVVSATACNR